MSFNVYKALDERYAPPAWAMFWEVRDASGFGHKRSADAIAMSIWPSRGLELHGFEIKHSRSDWLREKKDIKKAEALHKYCDRWWLVVSDPEIVLDGELPPTWGLLVPRGKKLIAKVEATKLKPVAVDRPFLAALLRRAAEAMEKYVPRDKIGDKLKGEYDRGVAAGVSQTEYRIKELVRENGGLKETHEAFRKNAGVSVDRWSAGEIGRIVCILSNRANRISLKDDLTHRLGGCKRDVETLEKALSELADVEKLIAEPTADATARVVEQDAFSETEIEAR